MAYFTYGISTSVFSCVALALSLPAWGQTVGESFILEETPTYQPALGEEFYGGLTAGPGEYFAVWFDNPGSLSAWGDIYGTRILPDGSIATPGSLEIFSDSDRIATGFPTVAWNGSVYLVLWHELDHTGVDILYGARVDQSGNVLDPGGFVIDVFDSLDLRPAVASDGQDFLVVQSGANGSLVGVRVGGDGIVLDLEPITISSGATGLGFPEVCYADGVYMVVWAQTPNQAIRGARVTSEGDVLDPGGFNISPGGFADADAFIDFDGQNFYVVWTRAYPFDAADLMAAHVTPQGLLASGPTLLLDGSGFGIIARPHVAWNGTHHLITIVTGEPLFSTTDLYALRVDGSGAPVGAPFPVSIIEAEGAAAEGIAAVGSQWFILWEGAEVIGSSVHYDTEAARVDADGAVLDQPHLEVATSASWQVESAAASDGDNFLCVFDDHGEGPPAYFTDLYAVRVTPEGERIESSGFAIDTTPGAIARDPEVIFDGAQYAVVYVHDQQPVTGVELARVLPDGTVLDPDGITVYSHGSNSNTRSPRIASNGTDYCIVWWDGLIEPGSTPLQYALVGHDGTIKVPPTNVAGSGEAIDGGFSVASNGEGFVIVWTDFFGCGCIQSTAISEAGSITGSHIVHSDSGGPLVAWNGDTYLTVWDQWDDGQRYLRARQVDANGAPIGPMVDISGPHASISALLLFPDGEGFELLTSGYRLFDLSADGTPLGEPIIFSAPSGFEPDWATGPGESFIVTFSKWASNPYNGVRARARIVDFSPGLPADLDGDGSVGFNDLLILLASWGDCPPPPAACPADLDGSGDVGFNDLLILLAGWS